MTLNKYKMRTVLNIILERYNVTDFYSISNKNESYTEITRATHSNQTTTLANKIGSYSKTSFIDCTTTNKIINNFSYVYFVSFSR